MNNQPHTKRDPKELRAGEYAYLADYVISIPETKEKPLGLTCDDLGKPCQSLCDGKTCIRVYKEMSIC